MINYIDLGLHKGNEIAYMHKLLTSFGHDFKIYGIEANPKYYNYCKTRFSKHNNIEIYNYAISRHRGKIKLYLDKKAGLGSSIYDDKNNVTKKFVEIDSYPLSTLIEKFDIHKSPDILNIIKSNIEGAEYELVLDMQDNNLFELFDCYLGGGKIHGWSKDLYKIPSMKKEIKILEKILADNSITIYGLVVNNGINEKATKNFNLKTFITDWIKNTKNNGSI